jgi:hypothetical protein
MREVLKDRTLGLRYIAVVMAVFGLIALVLAIVGVYGVMAFFVHSVRTKSASGSRSGRRVTTCFG